MSAHSVLYVLNHVQVPPPEKFILTVLAFHACTPHNIAWPSEARLAKETGFTIRGIRNFLNRLETKGWIQTVRGRPRGGLRYFVVTEEHRSCVISLTGEHGCERQRNPVPLERKVNTDKEEEIARTVPTGAFLTNFLGLTEGSEVFEWCLNGESKGI